MTRQEAERQTRQADTLRGLGFTRDEADALRRISMTLQRWFELECGNSDDYGSWCLVRGRKAPREHSRDPETQASIWTGGEFTHDDDGAPFMEHHHYGHGRGKDTVSYRPVADRETGARRRLAAIVAARNERDAVAKATGDVLDRRGALTTYIQSDPRGAALYILRPGDVPEGQDAGSYYTRGICVY